MYKKNFQDRTADQNDILSYSLHLTSSLIVSTFGTRSSVHEFGPIDKIMAHTIYKIAVFGGWGEPTIDVTRMLFKVCLSPFPLLKLHTKLNADSAF